VAGSAHAAFAPANFDGFLSELTGLEVVNKSGADPLVYGSLIATVTDPAFKDAAPRYLVWEFPPSGRSFRRCKGPATPRARPGANRPAPSSRAATSAFRTTGSRRAPSRSFASRLPIATSGPSS
jgi:hypothetical protein